MMGGNTQTANRSEKADAMKVPQRRRLPDTRRAIVHRFSVGGVDGYIVAGLYEDGRPGEIFIFISKSGTTLRGMTNAFAILLSLALQSGMDLRMLIRKFEHSRFEPSGLTNDRKIPIAKSIIDYLFRWLDNTFLKEKENEATA